MESFSLIKRKYIISVIIFTPGRETEQILFRIHKGCLIIICHICAIRILYHVSIRLLYIRRIRDIKHGQFHSVCGNSFLIHSHADPQQQPVPIWMEILGKSRYFQLPDDFRFLRI